MTAPAVADWIWFGTNPQTNEHCVSFGRWPENPWQHRYKFAISQPTERDHLKSDRPTPTYKEKPRDWDRGDGVATRDDMTYWTQAEIFIWMAKQEIERLGGSDPLTHATNLLAEAKRYVANHVEGQMGVEDEARALREERDDLQRRLNQAIDELSMADINAAGGIFQEERHALMANLRMAHSVFRGTQGWYGLLERPGQFMERGPYRFEWMARLSFPIIRITGWW